jgi:membrane-associated phospholipid phosphatase
MPAVWGLAMVALIATAAAIVVYLVALRTGLGFRLDDSVFGQGVYSDANPRVYNATSRLLDTIDVSSLAVFGFGIATIAVVRRRPSSAIAAGILIVGANVTTQVLKRVLDSPETLGTSGARDGYGAYPSGHATVALSLALALVIAAPPALRGLAAVAGALYASGVGIAVVALGWHYPSDVLGGFAVCAAWAAVAAIGAWAFSGKRRAPVPREMSGLTTAMIAIVSVAAAAATVAIVRRDRLIVFADVHPRLIAGSIAIAATAAVASLVLARLMARLPVRAV